MASLSTHNLSKHFDGVAAVDKVSFSVKGGTITSIIGPNGSGKTTLINLLTGMIPFGGGTVTIGAQPPVRHLTPRLMFSSGIARTFQEVRLFNQMTVRENIMVALTERDVLRALFEKHHGDYALRAESALYKVGLWEKRDEFAVTLSYGQRKLLEIARVIALSPEILFLDEPFAGLFPQTIDTIVGLLKEFRRKGKTIVLIEHNMELIRELSDYVIVMDSGKILAEGVPDEVLQRREVIEAYLGI